MNDLGRSYEGLEGEQDVVVASDSSFVGREGKQSSDGDPMEGVWEATSCCAVPPNPGVRHPGVSS